MWMSSTQCQTTSRFACGSTVVLNLRVANGGALDRNGDIVILLLAGEEEELRGELDAVDYRHC
jgi:hypothetical protein